MAETDLRPRCLEPHPENTMRFTCPKCQAIAVADENQAGATVSCPQCGAALRLPAPSAMPRLELDETPQQPRSVSTETPSHDAPIEDSITQGIPSPSEPRLEETEAPPPRFETQPYQSDGGVNPVGVVLMTTLVVVAGLFLGVTASLVSRLFYLILIFPVAIGIGTGAAGMWGVKIGKVRNVFITGLIGFLGGCVAMFTMHYCDYLHALDQLPEVVQQQVNFIDYIDATAEQGVSISRATSSSKGINLGYVGTYIYYAVEVLIVAVISLICGITAAAAPFCGRCNTWKTEYALGHVENPPHHAVKAVVDGELHALQPSLAVNSFVQTIVHVCPNCRDKAPIELKVQRLTRNEKNEEKTEELIHRTYPGEALAVVRRLFPHVPLGDERSEVAVS